MNLLLSPALPINQICFYGFGSLLILSALMLIFSPNPVQSALYLMLTFFASAALWIMAQAEFLGLILILVYVGAVMTLFLFVVMTVPWEDSKKNPSQKNWLYFILSCFLGLSLIYFLFHINQTYTLPNINLAFTVPSISNTQTLGIHLYTQYLIPFEMAGLILLIAIIAAISLSKKYDRQKIVIDPADQIRVQANTRLKIINMPSESQKIMENTHES